MRLIITFASNSSVMSIEVQNVSKSYGTQKALDNVSFSVKKGEILVFLGQMVLENLP